jgi:hypothetical protein
MRFREFMAQIKTFQMGAYFGHTAQLASFISGITPNLQSLGTTTALSSLVLGQFSADVSAPLLVFYKSRGATIGTATVVQSGDALGTISWYGAQQTGTFTNSNSAASIQCVVDGTVTSGASGDMPGRLTFNTSPDGSGGVLERLRIDSTGLLTIPYGQIAFPAAQNASANVNTLDDYEEGTWTPSVTSSTGTITTVGTVSGWYRKIGGIVTVFADATITTNGTGAGYINIAGLPFTSTAAGAVNGKETATEKALAGFLSNGTTTLTHITFYDGTYPGANGNRFLVACSYPAA